MPDGNDESGVVPLTHDDASPLFPIEAIETLVHRGREAELALASVDHTDRLNVAPTSLASSYYLTQHTLTAIPIDALDPSTRSQLDAGIGPPLDSFTYIQIGSRPPASPDHALTEYTDTGVPNPRS